MIHEKYPEYKARLKRTATPTMPRDGNVFILAKAWVCIGWRDYDHEIFDRIPVESNINVHIVMTGKECLVGDMLDVIEKILEDAKFTKITIHTPYELHDIWNFLNNKNEITLMRWTKLIGDKNSGVRPELKRISFEYNRGDLVFGTTKHPPKHKTHSLDLRKVNYKLRVHYEGGKISCTTLLYEDKTNIPTSSKGAIQTRAQQIDPEAHKEEIIANFKSVTRLGILKTFRDENDIWNYIMKQGPWANKEKSDTEKKSMSNMINEKAMADLKFRMSNKK